MGSILFRNTIKSSSYETFSRGGAILSLVLWVFTFHTLACQRQSIDHSAQGSQLSAATVGTLTKFQVPTPRPQAVLDDLAKSLVKTGWQKLTGPTGGIPYPASGTAWLKHSYLSTILKAEGLPRIQGESVLNMILASNSTHCGGTSCSKVFGLKMTQVPAFLDKTLAEVATNPKLLAPEHVKSRLLLLASLAPEQAFKNTQGKNVRHIIARIYLEKPQELPIKAYPPSHSLDYGSIERRAGSRFIDALFQWTSTGSAATRQIESLPDEQLANSGWTTSDIAYWQGQARTLNKGIESLPKAPGTTYRGMREVPGDTIAQWVGFWYTGRPFGLGYNHAGAVTSTTWDPAIANKFSIAWGKPVTDQHFNVLCVIEHKSGVSIEGASIIPSEKEILLPTKARFKIESIAPVVGYPQVIMIKLKETQAMSASGYGARAA